MSTISAVPVIPETEEEDEDQIDLAHIQSFAELVLGLSELIAAKSSMCQGKSEPRLSYPNEERRILSRSRRRSICRR